jgi:protein-disulfide isomerase
MASRKEQKEAARTRRLAEEAAAQQKAQRTRRMQMLGGVIVAAIIIVVVLVVVSSGGSSSKGTADATKPESPATKSVASTVNASLAGIHQSGNVLGSPKAKVTMTEYGDLECSVCKAFALGAETQLIANEVKQGTVKIVYKSYETATSFAPDGATIFPIQQSAAYAAGAQDKAWNYLLLFYHEQGAEDTDYVNTTYLNDIAKQVPGLDFAKWSSQRFNPTYTTEVTADHTEATNLGITGTPGLTFSGPKAQTKLYSGELTYSQVKSLITEVS